jgi:hypothetical protein
MEGLKRERRFTSSKTVYVMGTKQLVCSARERIRTSVVFSQKLPSNPNLTALEDPPYSPDLPPLDFIYFPRIKMFLKDSNSQIPRKPLHERLTLTGISKKLFPRNTSENFMITGKILSLSKEITLKEMFCK